MCNVTDRLVLCRKFLGKGISRTSHVSYVLNSPIGYKVGRVDQAETALGAEMRLAADKSNDKGKKKAADAKGDKIVRR